MSPVESGKHGVRSPQSTDTMPRFMFSIQYERGCKAAARKPVEDLGRNKDGPLLMALRRPADVRFARNSQ